MSFAQRIRELRKAKSWSVYDLAKAIRVLFIWPYYQNHPLCPVSTVPTDYISLRMSPLLSIVLALDEVSLADCSIINDLRILPISIAFQKMTLGTFSLLIIVFLILCWIPLVGYEFYTYEHQLRMEDPNDPEIHLLAMDPKRDEKLRFTVKSPGYVSKIEARGEIPSPEMIIKLADALEADIGELFELAKSAKANRLHRA